MAFCHPGPLAHSLRPRWSPPSAAPLLRAVAARSTTPHCVLHPTPDAASPSTEQPDVSDAAWAGLQTILPHSELRLLQRTGQYLGNEGGAFHKPWESVALRFCLAYPDLYSIGMSSTGHVILYSCLNDAPDVLCDRAYLPEQDMQAALQKHTLPLFAVESKRPLADFDVIGMSLSYELGATNCIKLLQLAHLPVLAADRHDDHPLIFAGGITVTANPEPYADFFDFFSIGDGEDMLPEIAAFVTRARASDPSISRRDLLLALARAVPGVYVPQFYAADASGAVVPIESDVPRKIARRNSEPQPWRATALVPLAGAVHDRLTVEIRRGCTRGCRFCLPGNVQRPARDVAPEQVKRTVLEGLDRTGYNEFSLLSLSCSDWLSLPSAGAELKAELKNRNAPVSLSLGSQRIDRFDENIAYIIGGTNEARSNGITFAPEAGTQRMRDVINKGLTDSDLVRGVRLAYEAGYRLIKLYFMINLPSETAADVQGIVDIMKHLSGQVCQNQVRFNLTVSTFTPKCWTPFQWHSSSKESVQEKQRLILKSLKRYKNIKLSFTDIRLSTMEDFIGRGDRRLGRVIRRASDLGAGMDAWWEQMDAAYNAWCQAIEESGLSWEYRRVERGEWNIMDTAREEVKGTRGWYDKIRAENLDRKNLNPKKPITVSDDPSHSTTSTGDNDDDKINTSSNSSSSSSSSETTTESTSPATVSPLDKPLPWDHIDVGLSKGWLRDELMRALTESLTPDCSFDECSSCGVCGDDMGHNVMIPAPNVPLPAHGEPYTPPGERVQRVRITFAKRGALALVSHLDLGRLLDRLARRARVPVSYSGGFSPKPRISVAAALPFGCTAGSELLEIMLHERVDVQKLLEDLREHAPSGLYLLSIDDVDVSARSLPLCMRSATYAIAIDVDRDTPVDWQSVVKTVRENKQPVYVDKTTKRGRLSKREIRSMLLDVDMATPELAAPVLNHVGVEHWPTSAVVLRCETVLLNDTAMNPEAVVSVINAVMQCEDFRLVHAHRHHINLEEDRYPTGVTAAVSGAV